jgi:acetyltransferase-like isoleucine patch superfamily enzyme
MIDTLRNFLAKRWLKQRGIKLSHGVRPIPRGSRLILETGTSINVEVMRFRNLRIGGMTYIRSDSELLNVSDIGRFCSISNNVIIGQERGGAGHSLNAVCTNPFILETAASPSTYATPPATEIGHDVWIGRDVMVMEGVRIGTGAVIAARSIVTGDVPAYAIVAGSPARIIRYRHPPDLATRLIESRWWKIGPETLKQLPMDNPELFLLRLQERTDQFQTEHPACLLTRSTWGPLPAQPELR